MRIARRRQVEVTPVQITVVESCCSRCFCQTYHPVGDGSLLSWEGSEVRMKEASQLSSEFTVT